MTVRFAREQRSQAEEVRLRFRTTRPIGLLLTSSTEQSGDRLLLALTQGRLRLNIRIGDKEKVREALRKKIIYEPNFNCIYLERRDCHSTL